MKRKLWCEIVRFEHIAVLTGNEGKLGKFDYLRKVYIYIYNIYIIYIIYIHTYIQTRFFTFSLTPGNTITVTEKNI